MKTKGLSLAEAHKSGRKYRRPHWSDYLRLKECSVIIQDAVALDWEIEPEAKLLTRDEVDKALLFTSQIASEYRLRILDALFGKSEEDV